MKLDELYQEVILDHFKRPRCQGKVDKPSAISVIFNPLCGDQVDLSVRVEGGTVQEIAFGGHGCSISQASASMMSDLCRGKSADEIRRMGDVFRRMMRGEITPEQAQSELGDAVALEGVRKFSARVKCAMLAWEAIEKCLDQVLAEKSSS